MTLSFRREALEYASAVALSTTHTIQRARTLAHSKTLPRFQGVLYLLPAILLAFNALARDTLDLSGEWRLRLDPEDIGLSANWPASPLAGNDRITLPNTTDRAGIGFPLDTNTMLHAAPFPATTRFPGVKEPVRADEHGYLVRRHLFVGPAWYEREIEIPQAWQGRSVALQIERAMWRTEVWVDGKPVGSKDSLVAEHRHELAALTPGRHRVTVRVDNRMIHNLSSITHAYGPETQSRWNGMIGKIRLEAVPTLSIRSLAVFPSPDRRTVRVVVRLTNNSGGAVSNSLRLRLLPERGSRSLAETGAEINCTAGESTHELNLNLTKPAQTWDEFDPVRYRIHATLTMTGGLREEASVLFGFRHIERAGREMRLNGRPVFLRGTLDCAVYPKTGHPPMSVKEWERVLNAVKAHGFNHVRFHTWCPPDAAFEAADRLGVYLQPEAPAWVDDWVVGTVTKPPGIGRDLAITEFLRAELRRMSEAYGNHPSFVLCTIGNEFGTRSTDWERVNAMVEDIKALDPRRLYSGCTARNHIAADDYWVTHHTDASTRGIGPAHTDWDFGKALAASPVPLIAHETGQRPVFPDYDALLPKFDGPLLPLNLERLRRALFTNGLASQVEDFVEASARFQLVQYKAEHEAMLRTRGYAGYQLLMLNDFTGQSEALVGILDPFWESKGVVTAGEVRRWNSPTVLLARFPKYVWTSDEMFRAKLEVAHFGKTELPPGLVRWSLKHRRGKTLAQGRFESKAIAVGTVSDLGDITASLEHLQHPTALTFSVQLAGAQNQWNIWVYPPAPVEPEPAGVLVAHNLDDTVLERLKQGGKVVLLAHGVKNARAAQTGFESVYWSAGWWGNKFSSLGVLCDPRHPALKEFPNAGFSDWQWRDLCASATTFDLTAAPANYRPMVQPVPDFHFNTRLGHLFEVRVGQGSLLICGYDLSRDLDRRLAARQFRRSLFRYAASDAFRPKAELPLAWVVSLCDQAGLRRLGAKVLHADSEDRENGNVAENVLDGDPATFWHTRWQPRNDPLPHELIIDLGRELRLRGISYLPRQDQANGRIAVADVFASAQNGNWGKPQAQLQARNNTQWESVPFKQPLNARFLRVVVKAEVNGQPFAAIAELNVLLADSDR